MRSNLLTKTMFTTAGLSMAVVPLGTSIALAQDEGYQGQNYPQDQGYPQDPGYGQGQYAAPPPQGYTPPPSGNGGAAPPPAGYAGGPAPYSGDAPPPGYANSQSPPPPPPPGYDGTRPPPPPDGYQSGPDQAQQQAQDQQYAAYAEQWARAYCVKAHGDTGAGAVIGGIAGALLGSGIAGRGSHGTGALAGAAVGAAGGAVIARNTDSGATSPGCPPGFVVRGGAPAFAYGGYAGTPYVYAAPDWYRPWVYYGGAWVYRPYPYHVWYARHYYPRGYYGRGYYGHGYYRRHW